MQIHKTENEEADAFFLARYCDKIHKIVVPALIFLISPFKYENNSKDKKYSYPKKTRDGDFFNLNNRHALVPFLQNLSRHYKNTRTHTFFLKKKKRIESRTLYMRDHIIY
jgi:hypothetical protein